MLSFPTSFAQHNGILNDASVQDFILRAFRNSVDEPLQTVQVRKRSTIRTVLGQLVELVGVDLVFDQALYNEGAQAKIFARLRPGGLEQVVPQIFQMTVQFPDGTTVAVPIEADPDASDPGNAFKQSF
ncbi:hypothetical protein [Roseibium limicola]|uniref:Uncharacterized protein n=1 Tax=Roseibium limicola TaxID=2816037 RepID=A0A939EQV9_9HYPH|nr:hypothetical protein [Roseibium limicola]MBO0347036.1 hypothetical protein [Roseibium limicola]